MVQGKTKGLQAKTASSKQTKKAAETKKGKRYIPPKKAALVKQATMRQSLTAKISKSIEQQMVSAASPGKLTIMKGASDASQSSKAGSSGKKSGK